MNKTEAGRNIDSLIKSATEALDRYGKSGEIKYREPTDLLAAQHFLEQAKKLSEKYKLREDSIKRTEENVVGSFKDWSEVRQQLINDLLRADEALPGDFNRWVQEYQHCFPDKKQIITQWQELKKAIAGDAQQFEADLAETQQIVQSLRQAAERLYTYDRVNNEVVALGKVREAYDKAEALKNNYPLEERAIDLAEQAKQDYETRKKEWHVGLMTQAGLAKFTEVTTQLEQLKEQGVKTTRDIVWFNEAGEILESEKGELQLAQGEEIPIERVIDHVQNAKVAYADTKTKQHIGFAEQRLEQDPQGAIDILTEFRNLNESLLEKQHTTPIDRKLADYRKRLQQRQEASQKVAEAETETLPEKAWQLVLQAEAQDKNVPPLSRIKSEVAERLQIYLKQAILPNYDEIGILDGPGEDSWVYHLNRLAELQKLTAGYELLAGVNKELQAVLERLKKYQALDEEINEKLPPIEARLSANPQQANTDLKLLEEKFEECKRISLYPQLKPVRDLINAYINLNEQKKDWRTALGDKDQWFENLTAIEMAIKDSKFSQDRELQQLYQSYQARVKLHEFQDDKDEGLLSEGLEKEVNVIEEITQLLKEADDRDAQLARTARELKQWLHQKQADYQRIKSQLTPIVIYIQNKQFAEANTQLEALKRVYSDDPTLKQQERDLQVEWGAFLTNRLITQLGNIQTIQQAQPAAVHKILQDIDQLATLAGPGAVMTFQELKAACYLRLAALDRRQERKWLEDAENIVPEASPTYFKVGNRLAELRKDEDFHQLADLQDGREKLRKLEAMRVAYRDDVKILQILAETYLKYEEFLKAENIVELLQGRDRVKIDSHIITNLNSDIKNARKIHAWRAKVKKQLSDETSVASLSDIDRLITDEKELPVLPITKELTDWFEQAKTDYTHQLLKQVNEARERDVDLIGVSQKLIRVWALNPGLFEAKETLEQLADYSEFELQSNLEFEANDTSGQANDAPDWLNTQIERANELIEQTMHVEEILRFFFKEDTNSRKDKVNPLDDKIKKLTNHRNDLRKLRSVLAQLNNELDKQRRSRNAGSSEWKTLNNQADDLQTGQGKYAYLSRLRQHLAVKDFFNRVYQSQTDQQRLQQLFDQLEQTTVHLQYQVALTLIADIRAISSWEKYRFEDGMRIVWNTPRPIRNLGDLETELRAKEETIRRMWRWFEGYLNTVDPWQAIPIWWKSIRQENLLTDQELAFQLINYITADKSTKPQFLEETIQNYRKKLNKDNNPTPNQTTVFQRMSQHKRRGEWQKAFEVCQEALWGKRVITPEKLILLKKAIEIFIEMSPQTPPNEGFEPDSWYGFLSQTQQYSNLPENLDQRVALELVHFETIRLAVTEWLREMKQELDKLGKDYQIFMNNYRIVQESLNIVQNPGLRRISDKLGLTGRKSDKPKNAKTSGQNAFKKCKEICPEYPFSQAIRDQFEGS